jgi:hypothetical protein
MLIACGCSARRQHREALNEFPAAQGALLEMGYEIRYDRFHVFLPMIGKRRYGS